MKPDGWNVEMLSIEPEKLIVGERNVVIGAISVGVGVMYLGFWKFSAWWMAFAVLGIALVVVSLALIYRAWKHDPWLSNTYARFRKYPSFIPAHASIASSESLRAMYRKRAQLKR
jgi:type IV secretory pathway TrbD component